MNTIITIGRQYGSGGKEIGTKLAQYYNIPFYDKELLKVAAKESGICEEMFENFDEKPTTSFLYSLVMDPYALGYNAASFDMPLNQKVFLASFDAIKKVADEGPCIIVGRCADYALKDYDNKLNVFIRSHFPGINQDCGFGRFAAALDGDFIIFNFIKRCRRASGLRRPCGRLDEDNPVFTCFISRNDFYLQFRFLCILLIREILRFLFESQVFFGVRVVAVLTRSETQCHCKQCKGCRS